MGYVRRTIHAGDTVEVEEYYSNRYGIHDRRAPKENSTPEHMQEAYIRRQKKKLRWLMNENFRDGRDALVTLSWRKGDKKPATLSEVKEEAVKFIRRLRAEYERLGYDLKYIYCVEIGSRGSRHIHAVLSYAGELPVITLARCWDGNIDIKPLYTGDYGDLADYIVKGYAMKTSKATGEEPGHCYECSRNLNKPQIEVERIREKDIRKDIEVPEGYALDRSSVQEGVGNITGRPYRFYKLRRIRENCAGANQKAADPAAGEEKGRRPETVPRLRSAAGRIADAASRALGWMKERIRGWKDRK